MDLKRLIRTIPDYPRPGIMFRDVTTLLRDADGFEQAIIAMGQPFQAAKVDAVAGIEARGFILASPVAYHFGAGFVPVRKAGKLPWTTEAEQYELEYGTETLEIHKDAFSPEERVLIVDDVLATGGTARATAHLVERLGGSVVGIACLVELAFLKGRDAIKDYDFFPLISYD